MYDCKNVRMGKVVLYIASSIDGMIARNNGELDWLDALPNSDSTDYGYADFLNCCGTIIMGKSTYIQLLGFGIEWPYSNHKTYVVSSDSNFILTTPETYLLCADIEQFVCKLKIESTKDIWLVGGGKLIHHFLIHKLIDKMIICLAPVILGDGIQMFPYKSIQSDWELQKTDTYKSGIVSLTYCIKL